MSVQCMYSSIFTFFFLHLILEGKYDEALDLYSKAIELNPKVPAYYGNRSFCYIKTEYYGCALDDANKAIELDKKYIKVSCYCHNNNITTGVLPRSFYTLGIIFNCLTDQSCWSFTRLCLPIMAKSHS